MPAIDFQADAALHDQGRRRAQRWAAVDSDTGAPTSARAVFAALAAGGDGASDGAARRALLGALQACPFPAAFWECPPVRPSQIVQQRQPGADDSVEGFEFVLVDAPELLASVTGGADPQPFREHLSSGHGRSEVRCFPNLGGDADLVSPTQATTAPDAYGHLLGFVRSAAVPEEQKLALLENVGRAVLERCQRRLDQQHPVWVSTSGLGVAWLHVRVEDRPKYYTWGPYVGGGVNGKSGRRYA